MKSLEEIITLTISKNWNEYTENIDEKIIATAIRSAGYIHKDQVEICKYTPDIADDYCHRGYMWFGDKVCPSCNGKGWKVKEVK